MKSTIEKLYTSPIARVRAIRNRHSFKVYTAMILDDIKRNGRISIESKRHLATLDLISTVLYTEVKLYGEQL